MTPPAAAGRLAAIWRYPLKSVGAEELAAADLRPGDGLPFDRRWAVAHEAARLDGGWADCANFLRVAKAPALAAVRARLDETGGLLTLTHPHRPALTFAPAAAEAGGADCTRLLDWLAPLLPGGRAAPVGVYSTPAHGLTDCDYPSVSILNLASNRALGDHLGQPLSPLRWRANLWIEGKEPFAERGWVGRQLRIGTARLEVTEDIERCLATTANPDTGARDADTLGGLERLIGARLFAVAARVVTPGHIAPGDALTLEETAP